MNRFSIRSGDERKPARGRLYGAGGCRDWILSVFVSALLWVVPGLASALDHVVTVKDGPVVIFPKTSLGPRDLAIIVNDADPLSVRIGRYYQMKRDIPAQHVIHVRFPTSGSVMSPAVFRRIKAVVDARTSHRVQAYVLTWTIPYRVGCMSITTAFAMGFNPDLCGTVCTPTKVDPYFSSNSVTPYQDFGIRPTMMLAGKDFREVKALIDRGVASDGTAPVGTAYLVSTNDQRRNVRAIEYDRLAHFMRTVFKTDVVHANFIQNKRHVFFYFTGVARVPKLATNRFLPGAIGDDLTSAGGVLVGQNGGQTTVLKWLKAGVTGSYGTVVEPCNFRAKFPDPGVVIDRYMNGESLIEAYWKSVAMPGQGLFVGEPLANPFGGYSVAYQGGTLTIQTHALIPGRYAILAADSQKGPYHLIGSGKMGYGLQKITLKDASAKFYRLVRKVK